MTDPAAPPGRREQAAARTAGRVLALAAGLRDLPGADPLSLEIGCGHGHFLAAYAEAFPDRWCLGIDVSRDRIARAQRKARRLRAGRVRFLLADAAEFLAALPAGVTLREVFVLFPDPWPKRRHHKHRLLQPDFLTALARFCPPGARLHLRTDHEAYFRAAVRNLEASAAWALAPGPWPFEHETVFQARAATHHSASAARR